MESNFRHVAEELRREIEELLARVALLCRVFARGKEKNSLQSKLTREPGKYSLGGKMIQDAIGVRIACYFPEDIEIVKRLLCERFTFDPSSSTIDIPETDQFSVTRYNLIFRLPDSISDEVARIRGSMPIDTSFEVQLRSVLSEGWHEVEHDLRYKTKSHWDGQQDLTRALNGIVATLETAEWSMRRIFNDLAYRHYKGRNWSAMLHSRLRLRVQPKLSQNLHDLLDISPDIAKQCSRIDRDRVIYCLSRARPRIPVTLDNLVLVWNALEMHSATITQFTPVLIRDAIEADQSSAAHTAVNGTNG